MTVRRGIGRRWIGRSYIAVALIHALAAFALYGTQWAAMAGEGLVATADDLSPRGAAYWFLSFAPALAAIGLLVDAFEARGQAVPMAVPSVLLAALAAMVAVMPATGAWLLFVPTLALVLRARSGAR